MLKYWGAFVISLIILTFFGAYEYAVLYLKTPLNSADNAGLVELLKTLTTLVAGFWIGSSKGSQDKDATIAQQAVNTQEALYAAPPAAKAIRTPVAAFLVLAAVALALILSGQPASATAACTPPDLTTDFGVASVLVKIGILKPGTIQPEALTSGIKTFQSQHGLPMDGIVGSKTRAALTDAYCSPVAAPSGNPISGISQFTVDDLEKAIGIASKPPILTAEVACFGLIRDGLMALQDNADTTGDGLATVYVKAVRVNALKKAIVASDDCLAVCGRAESLVPTNILSRIPIGIVPTMCSVIKAATP
ncbi:MAG TPA: peptidoglycan-binding domain-containing protein [Aggregatilineaceae bacterium]|nr:peptidoglycan-binding domain-containing protein [Aggregatilineaceae bacterium]